MDHGRAAGRVKGETMNNRRIECAKYPECLDLAAKENRYGFSCEDCQAYLWEDPTEQQDMVGKQEKIMEANAKTCTKCGEEKALEYFSIGTGREGRKAQCKACDAKYSQELRERKAHGAVLPRRIIKNGKADVEHKEARRVEKQFEAKPDRLTELVNAHWNYVRDLLMMHGQEELDKIEYHYKTAMVHGYKHGQADAMSKA